MRKDFLETPMKIPSEIYWTFRGFSNGNFTLWIL